MMKENRMKKNKHGQTSVSCHTNTDISLQNETTSNSVNPLMLQKNNLGLKPFIFILALTAATSEMTEVDSSIDKLEMKKDTATLSESNVDPSDPRYTAFRIRDGVLAKTNAESLNEWFQKVKAFLTKELTLEDKVAFKLEEPPKRPTKKEYVETFYVMTIVNFDTEKPYSSKDYEGDFDEIIDEHVHDLQNNCYFGQLGLLVTPLDHTSNAKFSMIYNGIDKLWLLFDKYHEIMIDNLHNIGYEMIKGELINQLQIVLHSEMEKKYENDEELNSAASKFVDDLAAYASKFTPNDALFEKASLDRCAKYLNGSWYKSDIEKYATSIGAEQFVDEIEYSKLFKHLASEKYKDNITEYIRYFVIKLLAIIKDKKNKADAVNLYVKLHKSINRNVHSSNYLKLEHQVENYLSYLINQKSTAESKLKLIEEFANMRKNLAIFSIDQRKVLHRQSKIKNIIIVFSNTQCHSNLNEDRIVEVLMDQSVLEGCAEHYANNFDEKVDANARYDFPYGGKNDLQIQYFTIYGVKLTKLGDELVNPLTHDKKKVESCIS